MTTRDDVFSFRVINPNDRPMLTLVDPQQQTVTAIAELDRLSHEIFRAGEYVAAAADYLERRRQNGAVDVPEVMAAMAQLHATPGLTFGEHEVRLSARAAQSALDRLYEQHAGIPAHPVRVLTNPSPRKTLEGLGLIVAGLRQMTHGLPDLVRWLNTPGRLQYVMVGATALLMAVAAWATLKAGVLR